MKKAGQFALLAVALCTFFAVSTASAQTKLGLNAHYGLDMEKFQIGAEYHLPLGMTGLAFVPNFEYYLMDDPTLFAINADLHYAIGDRYTASFTPYVGAGLAITRWSFNDVNDTNVGVNLLGGANFKTGGRTMPFVQLEYRAGDHSDLSIGGGLRFRL